MYTCTPLSAVPRGPPQNFAANVTSSTQILLMWQSPASEVQNGRVRNYTISVFEVQTNTSSIYNYYVGEVSEDPMQLLVEHLHPYYDYVCSVAAVTIGPGPYTAPLHVRTFEDGEYSHFCIEKSSLLSLIVYHSLYSIHYKEAIFHPCCGKQLCYACSIQNLSFMYSSKWSTTGSFSCCK